MTNFHWGLVAFGEQPNAYPNKIPTTWYQVFTNKPFTYNIKSNAKIPSPCRTSTFRAIPLRKPRPGKLVRIFPGITEALNSLVIATLAPVYSQNEEPWKFLSVKTSLKWILQPNLSKTDLWRSKFDCRIRSGLSSMRKSRDARRTYEAETVGSVAGGGPGRRHSVPSIVAPLSPDGVACDRRWFRRKKARTRRVDVEGTFVWHAPVLRIKHGPACFSWVLDVVEAQDMARCVEEGIDPRYVTAKTILDSILSLLGDRANMANSVESRVPFLDHHLVEYVSTLPPSVKIMPIAEEHSDNWGILANPSSSAIIPRRSVFGTAIPRLFAAGSGARRYSWENQGYPAKISSDPSPERATWTPFFRTALDKRILPVPWKVVLGCSECQTEFSKISTNAVSVAWSRDGPQFEPFRPLLVENSEM
ncbi:hypothetical protein C8R44DRAFT_736007 [Mycena epipterygia]|nr:hypothetical protein C8R44DRAFT_736007 [Mycena epipterygia]